MERTLMTLIVLPEEEWIAFRQKQDQILLELSHLKLTKEPVPVTSDPTSYLTAKEFMAAIRIKRTKFDSLVATNKIKTIKKGRRIYSPASEVDRYFKDIRVL